ncbi:MAG: amidohydrolase family protein [Colwellia sp.]
MKLFNKTYFIYTLFLLLSSLLATKSVFAQKVNRLKANDFVIINATLYSATNQGIINKANIRVNQGFITEITQEKIDTSKILASNIIDAKGQIVTPGFIGVMNPLGLVEVNSESTTKDAIDSKLGINFDSSSAFNPKSTLLPLARQGGITRNVSSPKVGSNLFAGQTFVVNLSGDFDSVEQVNNAVVVKLGKQSNSSRATNLQLLKKKLNATNAIKATSSQKYTQEQQVLAQVIAKQKPLIIYAERASDLLHVIKLKKQFDINVVIVGAGDAVSVKEQLAKAEIPLIIMPIINLPNSFDTLHQSIFDAGILSKSGIKLIFMGISAHYLEQTRYNAGNAAANGMDFQEALKAISANIADVFSLNTGSIAVGKVADIVLWQGNPLDLNGHVDKMWIKGKEMDNHARQDSLRERYSIKSNMPASYSN